MNGSKQPLVRTGRLLLEWWITGTACFLLALAIRLGTITPDWAGADFNPWQEFRRILVMSPLGWLLHGCMFGPTWLSLLSAYLVLRFRRREFLVLAAAASIVFGWLWPGIFWGMMSV